MPTLKTLIITKPSEWLLTLVRKIAQDKKDKQEKLKKLK